MNQAETPGLVLSLATTPARLIGRFRPDLAASIDTDSRTFGGSRALLFSVLSLIAVAYPIATGLLRATSTFTSAPYSDLEAVLNPAYLYGYTESLPFMVVALSLGILSPALGVLFVLVHTPVDLVASAAVQVQPLLTPPEGAVPARLLSDAVLWLGVVELPLVARRLAAWAIRRSGRSRLLESAALAGVAAVLSYAWVSSAFWLTLPVFSWTVQGGPGAPVPLNMVFGAFTFAWIVVATAAVAGLLSGLLIPVDALLAEADRRPARTAGGFMQQGLRLVVTAFLLAGLMIRPSETTLISDELVLIVLIVGGLIVAGPVLTVLLPRLPVPGFVRKLTMPLRWTLAVLVPFVGSWLVLSLVPIDTVPDYLLLAVLFAITAPVARLIVDAGRVKARPAGAPTAVVAGLVTVLRVLVCVAIWLAIPTMAFAENESGMPIRQALGAAALLAGAAIFGVLAAFGAAGAALADEIMRSNRQEGDQKTMDDIDRSLAHGMDRRPPRNRR